MADILKMELNLERLNRQVAELTAQLNHHQHIIRFLCYRDFQRECGKDRDRTDIIKLATKIPYGIGAAATELKDVDTDCS